MNLCKTCVQLRDRVTCETFCETVCLKYLVINNFSRALLQFRKDEVQEEDDIPYKYGFFHLVFSLGAMYFAMLFINWDLNSSTRK